MWQMVLKIEHSRANTSFLPEWNTVSDISLQKSSCNGSGVSVG